jgi:DmsE family decaheme c-type cytochrome
MKGRRRKYVNSRLVFGCLLASVFLLAHAGYGQTQDKFKLKPDANGGVCINCHDNFKDVLKRAFVHTPLKAGQCTGCHDPHTSSHGKLLEDDPNKICLKCHGSIVPEKTRSVHKIVLEGNCVKCHDPHGAANKYNLLKAGNELCLTCHKEMGAKLGKVKFRHSPVDKGCVTCHDPHASVKAEHLLKSDTISLCLTCHKANGPTFAKQHMDYPVAGTRCTECHDPHGSNRGGILFDNVHSPVEKKMCSQCHEASTSATPLKIKRTAFELCRGCHNTMMNETLGKNRIHSPLLDKKGCLNCHTAHASPNKGLLNGDAKTVCGRCHGDTMEIQPKLAEKEKQEAAALPKGQVIKGALTHVPVQEGNCTACHSPHASDRPLLLKGPSNVELCGTCHDWLKHTSHPMGEKTVDMRNKNMKVDCLSCHRSHGTGYRHLIPFPAITDLCVQCHKQYRR